MANYTQVIRSEVSEIGFGLYSDEEIRALSCCHITSPVAHDTLGNPLPSGLYDPRMGCTDQNSIPCVTCELMYVNCPGHPGHIELCVPVYHPLLFPKMYALLRGQCANCHKFRLAANRMRQVLIKLKLIEMGEFEACEALDDLFVPPAIFTEEGERTTAADIETRLKHYESTYEAHKARVATRPSAFDPNKDNLHRTLVEEFYRAAQAARKCENCGAFSPPLRKDGFTKIFERPLAKKLQRSMDGMRIKLKSALEKTEEVADTFDSDTDDENDSEEKQVTSVNDKYLSPVEIQARLRLLWSNHSDLLYLIWGRAQNKALLPTDSWKMFFMNAVLVPPSRFRPAQDVGEMKSEHPQNLQLSKVLQLNEKIFQLLSNREDGIAQDMSDALKAVSTATESKTFDISKLVSLWLDLQTAVNCYMDSAKDPNPLANTAGGNGIRQLLERKEGLFRRHMMGKRVNYCCRSVISPDPHLGTDEIGIPVLFAKTLHYPTPVTNWNVKLMRQLVENGPDIYPGANQLETGDGKIIKLDRFTPAERAAKAKLLLSTPGMKVYRHLVDGDVLLVNRQPTLHKPGIMAHKARVLQHVKEQTIRMNYANCNTYNADFDGDEMNCHFVQNELARAEAYYICNTDNQYIVPTSGNPLRGLIQDHVASGVKLTCKDTFLTRDEYQQLLYTALTGLPGTELVTMKEDIVLPPPSILKPEPRWSGKQVITGLLHHVCKPPLPPLHLDAKSRTPPTAFGAKEQEHVVIIRFGELLCGVLDKNAVGNSNMGLVHAIYELYGSELAGKILNAFGRVFTSYLQSSGHTCGIEDLILTSSADAERRTLLNKVLTDAEIGLQSFLAGDSAPTSAAPLTAKEVEKCRIDVAQMFANDPKGAKLKLDGAMQGIVNKSASDVIKVCLPNGLQCPFPKNNFSMMVLTGAKGSAVNQSQISCFLGQQALEGQRVPIMISGKSLPSFKPYDTSARASGFITDRFLTGVRPQEYYFHCMAGREGLVDTAVKTSRSGYLQRCLMKHLEELRIHYDMTVRDASSNVVQFLYGEDGLDPVSSALLKGNDSEISFMARNYQSIVHKYSVHDNFFKQGLEMQSAKLHHNLSHRAKLLTQEKSNGVFAKRAVVLARRKRNPAMAWSRNNMEKKWVVAEIIKVRKPEKTGLSYVSYDLQYADKTIEKKVPSVMKVRSKSAAESLTTRAVIPLIRAGLPDPVMSHLRLDTSIGAISERLQESLESYMNRNPDGIVTEAPTDTTINRDGLELLVWIKYLRSLACPGEAVGCVAAQSVGEPSTQMTLNTFHLAGHGGANVTLGIPRLREIIMTASKEPKTPTMLIPLAAGHDMQKAKLLALQLSRISVHSLLHHEGGIEVGESMRRQHGTWERCYRIRLQFQNSKKIYETFRVTFESLETAVRSIIEQKLFHIIQLEQRRSGEKSSAKQDPLSQFRGKGDGKAGRGRGDDEEDGESGAKKAKEVDSEGEDEDEEDETDDAEQGTLKLGRKKEIMSYEDDEEGETDGAEKASSDSEESEETSDSSDDESPTGTAATPSKNKKVSKEVAETSTKKGKKTFAGLRSSEEESWIEFQISFPSTARRLLMVQLVEQAAKKTSVRSTKGISNAYALKCDINGTEGVGVQTEGVNFEAAWDMAESLVQYEHIKSNDIYKLLHTYGVEAARQSIVSEISGVFAVYGINVNPRHLGLIADFMTRNGSYVPMNRMGMMHCSSPLLQMSFETTCTFLTRAAQEGGVDILESPSARIVSGGVPRVGTGCFDLRLPLTDTTA